MTRYLRRGVALATALMLMALVLVIGLAVATSSMMSLNLARQDYQETRCNMLARSGVNELIARLTALEESRALQLFNPQSLDLRQAFPASTELLPGCSVTFNPHNPGYSTDNLGGDLSVAGWLDRGGTTRSVPPFTMELILHTEHGSYQRDYRALLRRVWPYAIYSAKGPVVLSGDPRSPNGGSHVKGKIFAAVRPDLTSADQFSLLGREAGAVAQVYNMFTGGMRPARDYNAPVSVGPPVTFFPEAYRLMGGPAAQRPPEAPVRYFVYGGTGENQATLNDHGNSQVGGVFYTDPEKRPDREARVYDGNSFQGQVHYRKATRNPLDGLALSDDLAGYRVWEPHARLFRAWDPSLPGGGNQMLSYVLPWPPDALTNPALYNNPWQNDAPIWVLRGPASLAGSQNSPSYWAVKGNLVNQLIADGRAMINSDEDNIKVDEYGFQLVLDDCLLRVQGSINLSNLSGDDPMSQGIRGNGGTLVVDGTLTLTGAQLQAGDRGMVIYARGIQLSGECDFKGLLVATESISIIPQAGKRIRIRGGIVTGGNGSKPGVTLQNVDVEYDPRYMKSLNNRGDYVLTGWEPI